MKKIIKNIIYFTCIFTALILTGSCTGDFKETNTDPNKMLVGQVDSYAMFEPALYGSANFWMYYTWYWNNELVQFTAFTGGTTREEHRYKITDANWLSVWNTYARYGSNINHMYELAVKEEDKAMQAVSLTLKVLVMENLTDMFGDIPYSEAFQAQSTGNTKPVFDSQKEVYETMMKQLDSANTFYSESPVFLNPAMDGMYGGDMDKWRKFNNSLHLRLLCRISGRSEMNAGSQMQKIIDNPDKYPVFTSNTDNATVIFSGTDPYQSQFGDYTENSFTTSGRKLAEQLISMTVITDNTGNQIYVDPRLPIWGRKNTNKTSNPDNIWKGTISGCTVEEQSAADAGAAYLNYPVFCRLDFPSTFMDYSEVEFILSEAAYKGYITGGEAAAKSYYEAGVTASMEKWSPYGAYSEAPAAITDSDILSFLGSDLGSWDRAYDKEKLIADQKFLALFWIGMEDYHEYRRTGYPVLKIGRGTIYNDYKFPSRFGYTSVTLATNSTNAQAALKRMGGENDMHTPLWWSKEAIEK